MEVLWYFFFLMIRRPPRSTRTDTLFLYTTLFRSTMSNESGAVVDGPLTGVTVVEIASIGPGPHAAMLLRDMGATILRVERPGGNGWPNPVVDRGRSVLELDLRSAAGKEQCLKLTDNADVLIEGFRPGVMERLGLGPEVLCERNSRLIYGRMTGWGQDGPLARAAGHDINYIALTGEIGRAHV